MLLKIVLVFLLTSTLDIDIYAYKPTNVKGNQEFFVVSTTEIATNSNTNQPDITKQLEETNHRLAFLEDKLLHTEKLLEKEQTTNEKLKQTIFIKNLESINCSQTLKNEQRHNLKLTQELNKLIGKISTSNTTKPIPKNCKEVLEKGNYQTGLYRIKPKNQPFTVMCDMTTRGGGWTVFQNRFDGSQNFYLNWTEYKNSFGDLSREFWLGLEYLHQLTEDGNSELFIKMVNVNHTEGYAYYGSFGIDSEGNGYSLKVLDGFEGDAGDSLKYHFGKKFVTKDRNGSVGDNCAVTYEGAWWFHRCHFSNLNGKYLHGKVIDTNPGTGINWSTFSTDGASLLASKMMVRPR